MSQGATSYYYMSSSRMTTYNENGSVKSQQHIRVDNNGNKDYYHKESVIENDEENIVNENGNKELQYKQKYLLAPKTNWENFFKLNWVDFLYDNLENGKISNNKLESSNNKQQNSNSNEATTTEQNNISNDATSVKSNIKKNK
jgi:hypothetical protein